MYIRNCLRSEEKKIIFYTTEKANCSEVVAIFFDYCDHLRQALEYSSWIHQYRWDKYVPANLTTIEDLQSEEYIKIKFVRCPFERAISSFAQRHRYKKMHESHLLSFVEFLDNLEENANIIRYETENMKINPHHLTQSFKKESLIKWDAIIHVENLWEELGSVMMPRRKLHFRANHWNKTARALPSGRDRSAETLQTCRTLYYPDLYNKKTIALVERLYEIDFNFHPEYTFEYFLERFKVPDLSLMKQWLLLH